MVAEIIEAHAGTMVDNDNNKRRRLVEFKDGCRYGKFGKTKAYELIADQTNAALNARVLPNRPHGDRCRGSRSCPPCQTGAAPTRRAAGTFFPPCRGRVGLSNTSRSNTPSSLSRGDAGERKPCAQWSSPGPVSQPGAPCSVCCRTLARHRHWPSSRSRISVAISAFGVGLARRATESAPKSSSTR